QEKINSFRNLIGEAWKSQARISAIFKQVGSCEHITDENIRLKLIGQRTFFEKAKMMFIDGEHHQMIYGVDRMGGEIGRWEDSEFFNTIAKVGHNKIIGTSILDVLNSCTAYLKDKKVNPSLILMAPEYAY